MEVRILGSAEKDLEKGWRFYELKRSGLGWYFLDSLFSDIDSLKYFGGIHMQIFEYKRMLSKRFPFAIYYKIKDETVIVYAVLDCRRNPEKIMERLK